MTTRGRLGVLAALAVVGVLVPGLLFVAQYPQWWVWIAQEQVPMTWFQSMVLIVAGVLSGLAWFVARLSGRTPRGGQVLLAAGFGALAFDERFALHERIRDGFLAPRDIRLPLLNWIGPGDFLLLLVAIVGLALLPVVVRSFGRDRWALSLLTAGVVLALIAVGADSVNPTTWSVQEERVQQTLEECIELWAGLSFLGAAALHLLGLLSSLVPAGTVDTGALTDRRDEVVEVNA